MNQHGRNQRPRLVGQASALPALVYVKASQVQNPHLRALRTFESGDGCRQQKVGHCVTYSVCHVERRRNTDDTGSTSIVILNLQFIQPQDKNPQNAR